MSEKLYGALCAGYEPELWFPLDEDGPGSAAARAVCARCPARQACLATALEQGADFGIWGGLSAVERRSVRADQAAA